MNSLLSLCAGAFLLYMPYLWCRYKKEDPCSYGLCWKISVTDIVQTLGVSALILSVLTLAALNWPWDKLPRTRSFGEAAELIASGFAAAVIEETFFRGWLQPMLERKIGPWRAIVVTNLIFAPLHLIAAPRLVSLLTFFPGLVMGWLKYRYKNLTPPALFHFIGNIWAVWFFPSSVGF